MQNWERPLREKTVVALGFFDSIHIGHRDIIAKTIGKARDNGCQSVLFTFSNNPAEFFGSSNKLIYTFEERCDIIAELGIDVAAFAVLTKISEIFLRLNLCGCFFRLIPFAWCAASITASERAPRASPKHCAIFFCRKA